MYTLNSPQLQNMEAILEYGKNIHYFFNLDIGKFKGTSFAVYYILKVPALLVEKVYFQDFFQSQRYKDAVEKKLFSSRWEQYIENRKYGEYYMLDARDYIGEIIHYMADNKNMEFTIEFFGNIFWVYHDLGHAFLEHLYTKGTFKHKDEMDASIFAVVKLLGEGIFNENDVKYEVMTAVKPLLKNGKYINKDDFKYFLYFMKYYQNFIPNYERI